MMMWVTRKGSGPALFQTGRFRARVRARMATLPVRGHRGVWVMMAVLLALMIAAPAIAQGWPAAVRAIVT